MLHGALLGTCRASKSQEELLRLRWEGSRETAQDGHWGAGISISPSSAGKPQGGTEGSMVDSAAPPPEGAVHSRPVSLSS